MEEEKEEREGIGGWKGMGGEKGFENIFNLSGCILMYQLQFLSVLGICIIINVIINIIIIIPLPVVGHKYIGEKLDVVC